MTTCPHCGEEAVTQLEKIFWMRTWQSRACPHCEKPFRVSGRYWAIPFLIGVFDGYLIENFEHPIDWYLVILTIILMAIIQGFIPLVPPKKAGN